MPHYAIYKGYTAQFRFADARFPVSEWTGAYMYVRQGTEFISVTGVQDAGGYFFNFDPSLTENRPLGIYAYQVILTKADGTRIVAEEGTLELLVDLASAATYDPISDDEKLLNAIDSVLAGKATKDVDSYVIGTRTLRHIPITELLELRKSVVRRLNAKRASGLRSIRFSFADRNV